MHYLKSIKTGGGGMSPNPIYSRAHGSAMSSMWLRDMHISKSKKKDLPPAKSGLLLICSASHNFIVFLLHLELVPVYLGTEPLRIIITCNEWVMLGSYRGQDCTCRLTRTFDHKPGYTPEADARWFSQSL